MAVRRVPNEASVGGSCLVRDVAGIAAAPGGAAGRAEALLERIRRVVPFEASFLALQNPDGREHLALVRSGYDDRTCAFLDSPTWMADIESLGMHRERAPVRLCDFAVPPEAVLSWAEYLVPAGFREAIGMGLFTPDGRYIGVVGMHTESAEPVSDAVRDLLGAIAPMIAHAVDPLRSVAAMAVVVSDAVAGVVVTHAGTALPLPGLPAHPLLVTGSAVLRVAVDQLDGVVHAIFLSPVRVPGAPDEYLRVTVMSALTDPPYDAVAVVMLSPPRDLHSLTPRELEALGLLVEGCSNRAISLALGITERTVAAHIEHILTKLAATSRTVAAVSALRGGLFVPRVLHSGAAHRDEPPQ
jgi:DNA-binding CsgD family transcriptional regulator